MKTPAGKECKYFYGDYYRGRNVEECRLLGDAGLEWSPYMCEECPVPSILMANSCEHMKLIPQLKRPLLIRRPQVQVNAYCTKINEAVEEPRIGCRECHPNLIEFVISPDDTDPTD